MGKLRSGKVYEKALLPIHKSVKKSVKVRRRYFLRQSKDMKNKIKQNKVTQNRIRQGKVIQKQDREWYPNLLFEVIEYNNHKGIDKLKRVNTRDKKDCMETILTGTSLSRTILPRQVLAVPDTKDDSFKAHLYYRAELILRECGLKFLNLPFSLQQKAQHFSKYKAKYKTHVERDRLRLRKIQSIEYVCPPAQLSLFAAACTTFTNPSDYRFAFHGSSLENFESILQSGFNKPGDKNYKSTTRNLGVAGAGSYFSPYASTALRYSRDFHGCTTILLCVIITGKQFIGVKKDFDIGMNLKKGYDCHRLENQELEYVIFHKERILPLYLIHF